MKITPALIAEFTHGSVEGASDIEITGFARIEEAKPGEITFLSNPKYTHFVATTKASAILVNEDFELPEGVSATIIRVKNSYSALAELLMAVEKMKPSKHGVEQPCYIAEGVHVSDDSYVGAFAYIGAGVTLGKNVKIYPQAYIGDGVAIGDDTIIYAGVKIYQGCRIGNRCVIHAGAVIGADGFGFAPNSQGVYEKIPQIGHVEIADDVEIGANTCVDRATFATTKIGRGTKLDNLLQIGHNVQIGEDNVFAAQTGVAGSTVIGNRNRVGGQCGFAGHIQIGDDNEFGAQSGIPNTVGSKKRLIGYPAVDALQFAKTQVYLKRINELFKKI